MKTKKPLPRPATKAKGGLKTEDMILLAAGAGVVGYAFYKKKQNAKIAVVDTVPTVNTPVTTNPVNTTPGTTTLNSNLVLKQGSTGNEVKQLQSLLGVTADGIFGAQTAAALLAKKGVSQITLAQYNATASVNNSALAVGTTVMAAAGGAVVNMANKLANGGFTDSGIYYDTIGYGKLIGKIISVSTSKNYYVVEMSGFLGIKLPVWLAASQVTKV